MSKGYFALPLDVAIVGSLIQCQMPLCQICVALNRFTLSVFLSSSLHKIHWVWIKGQFNFKQHQNQTEALKYYVLWHCDTVLYSVHIWQNVRCCTQCKCVWYCSFLWYNFLYPLYNSITIIVSQYQY